MATITIQHTDNDTGETYISEMDIPDYLVGEIKGVLRAILDNKRIGRLGMQDLTQTPKNKFVDRIKPLSMPDTEVSKSLAEKFGDKSIFDIQDFYGRGDLNDSTK